MTGRTSIERRTTAGLFLAVALQASGVAFAAPARFDPAQVQAKISTLAVKLVGTARTAGDRSSKVDVNTLRSQIETALLSDLAVDGADASTAIAALRKALGAAGLKPVEHDAIRELLEKLLRSAGLSPAGLGLDASLVPAPLGVQSGGSGYRGSQ